MARNRLLSMLDEHVVPIGMQCFTGNHTLIEVLGATGFDYVWLDSEHSALNPRALDDTMRTCENAGLVALVRIPEPSDGTSARRALEAGAQGIVVPMVRSAADVQGIVDALTFPPRGTRGLCPALRVPGYTFTGFNDYMCESDDNLLIIPMIETVDALENIDEICALEQVTMLVFASGELAFAMGEGATMHSSTKVRDAQQVVYAAAKRHGVAVIGGPILNPSTHTCSAALESGISMLCIGLDVMAFRQVCETTVAAANAAAEASGTYTRPPAPPSAFPHAY
ncbi:HpcH/HpaI aldolase family protein [Amycolatopsis sp. H20-H5]|uniref:HpcH/HpaI aldolase family protein n=1 Tax=Amycolatopsis sp. H20-H5 TaxID=3046309 RepID=UPI002DBD4704|nr:aldolase/citrate lyase family protein [Amycolatopsis sp. H20-H5]MEC3976962.1 aldolase/citrate lyase family protein [Amycolatopsis sp. H20-H5]